MANENQGLAAFTGRVSVERDPSDGIADDERIMPVFAKEMDADEGISAGKKLIEKVIKAEVPIRKHPHINAHLANERTFLAWIRTSLGLIAFGFVLERFNLFSSQFQHLISKSNPPLSILHTFHESKITIFGIFLISCGTFLSLLAFYKYIRLEKQINNEVYAPSYMLEGTLTSLLFLSGIFLILYLVYS